ncbi:MAG: hypothetical protein MJ221_04390 [Bacilli bacterium]|nr:hypothetical protein [Bacilli bacterium]
MGLEEILNCENRTDENDLFTIHLYLENDWWRAYEWSAYLCVMFPNGLTETEKLKPTNKEQYILVGLKLSSFTKYFPKVQPTNITEKHIAIDVRTFINSTSVSLTSYREILSEWKKTIPLKKEENTKQIQKQNNKPNTYTKSSNTTILSVMQEVIAYPLETKTLIDNTLFIRHLKDELLKLI